MKNDFNIVMDAFIISLIFYVSIMNLSFGFIEENFIKLLLGFSFSFLGGLILVYSLTERRVENDE